MQNDLKMVLMKKIVVHLYLALWCLYNLQGTLYVSGGVLSRSLFGVLIVWSLYYFVIANLQYRLPRVMKILSLLIAIWTIYGVISLLTRHAAHITSPYYYLRNILGALLPIYSFFVFTKKEQLTERVLTGWLYVFLIIGIAQFYRGYNLRMQETGREEVTNNAGYTVLSIMPLLPLLRRRPIIQYSFFAVLMFYVFQGFKRGAIVAGVLCSVFFLIETIRISRRSRKGIKVSFLLRILLTIIMVIVAVYVIQHFMLTSDYFNRRLDATLEGDSSGRDMIYSSYYSWFINQNNIFAFVFGNGGDATLKLFGNYAHNDWLEIAIDNGLWMVLLYAFYWISLLFFFLRLRKKNTTAYIITGMFFIVYFCRTIVSMSYNDISTYAACALGYAIAIGELTTQKPQEHPIEST